MKFGFFRQRVLAVFVHEKRGEIDERVIGIAPRLVRVDDEPRPLQR